MTGKSLRKTIQILLLMCYILKNEYNKNQIIPLMIPNGRKWHHRAVRNYLHY